MPATQTSVAAQRSRPKVPKLRSSCDGCGTAKVKCDRGRPQCGRCETLRLTCVYGPSRKMGKPPRKRPTSRRDTIGENSRPTPGTAAHSRANDTATTFGKQHSSLCEPAHNSFFNPAGDINFSSSGINTASAGGEHFLPLEEWPQIEDWQHFDTFGVGPCYPQASPPKPASTSSQSSDEAHSCARESYEIFRDLICPTPSLHAPESNSVTVSAQLDEVLQFNRNAIERLTLVLRCPCATSGHRAMVHASIVSRILIWYQQAAGSTGRNSSGPSSSELIDPPLSRSTSPSSCIEGQSRMATDTGTTNPTSLVQTTGFSVEHVPVSIGSFSIEDQKIQAAFRNQLVLCELKKTAKLIDMFTSQELGGTSSSGGVAGLYSHLGIWLRSELSRTVNILKSKLNALNEELES